jgi:hypothetical protein
MHERNNRGTVGGGVLCWVRAEAIFNIMLYVRYVHVTEVKHIHKRQTQHNDYDRKGSVAKKKKKKKKKNRS